MPDAELEIGTWAKLALIAERARREPRCQFTSLAHLLNERFLAACYHRLGRDRASGVDGVTWKEYGEHLEENLRDLVTRMKAKRYKPQPAKRVYIPKDEHSQRPLGLPALEDKIVQKGIAEILSAIHEADFLDCSYGFRPGRGCHQAINAVDKTIMTQPINHVIDADIKGFFDSVSHAGLMKCLRVRVKDPNFLLLIERFLKAGYFEAGEIVATERGTPQGGNLSPMLSNIFLHYVLDLWFEKRVKRQVRGVSFLVRYADDFICMAQCEEGAQSILQAVSERFAAFDLALHPEKTRVIGFGRNERRNARRENRRPETFDFLGFTHYCWRSRRGSFIVGRKTSGKKFRKKCRELNEWLKAVRNTCPVKEWWPVLRAKLRGHYQYYGLSGNMRTLRMFHRLVVRMALKWLNRRSQRRSFRWEQFWAYLNRYPLPEPRIVHNLYTLRPVT
ncbi:MAG: group II intron reverse transcriptase/maturase [Planctomycetes bacterium]|nr:group II intron reverse transcriptase/maturase [Planctomycetota bacterium]MBU4400566.1 group II intron reverse transcriptase/maturase [Planctomycetota bacterium]MCG2682050.1 group II intron reverse transcriptase/maturase [Planctomycetales bacterium]